MSDNRLAMKQFHYYFCYRAPVYTDVSQYNGYWHKRSKGQWVVAIQEYIFTIVATL